MKSCLIRSKLNFLFSSAPQVNAPLFFIAAATLSATSPTCFLYATFQVQRIPLRNSSTTVQELRYFIRRTHPSAPCCRSTRCCRRGATTRCSPPLFLRILLRTFSTTVLETSLLQRVLVRTTVSVLRYGAVRVPVLHSILLVTVVFPL